MKPTLFIGSSVEALSVSYAMQQELEHAFEPTVWTQGIFDLSKSTLQSLLDALDRFEFAVFVFQQDDLTLLRGTSNPSVRDNVVFEFGLFLGRLGPAKTFFVVPRGDSGLHIPTDLLGICPAKYEPNRSDGNLRAAVGPACTDILIAIEKSCPKEIRDLVVQLSPRMKRLAIKSITTAKDYSGHPPESELENMDLDELDLVAGILDHKTIEVPITLGSFPLAAAMNLDKPTEHQKQFWLKNLREYDEQLKSLGY